MGDRYVKSDENKKKLYIDGTNLYVHSMSQPLPFDEIKFERIVCLKEKLNIRDDNDFGYFLEVDLRYLIIIRQKTKPFHFTLENKIVSKDDFNDCMKKNKPKKIYIT